MWLCIDNRCCLRRSIQHGETSVLIFKSFYVDSVSARHWAPSAGGSGTSCGPAKERHPDQNQRGNFENSRGCRPPQPDHSGLSSHWSSVQLQLSPVNFSFLIIISYCSCFSVILVHQQPLCHQCWHPDRQWRHSCPRGSTCGPPASYPSEWCHCSGIYPRSEQLCLFVLVWLAQQMHVAHQTGLGVGVILLLVLLGGVIYVAYRFHYRSAKPFHFQYFKVSLLSSVTTSTLAHQTGWSFVFNGFYSPRLSDSPWLALNQNH